MFRFVIPALAGVFVSSAALAEPSVVVRFGDLDLQNRSDAKVMASRINTAAHRVCGTAPVIADLGGSEAWRQCVKATSSRAIARLNAPLVTAASRGLGATNRTVAAVGFAR